MKEDSGVPDDTNEDQTPDEDEQSTLDQAIKRLKSHLSTTAGRVALAVVGVALLVLIIGLVRACSGEDHPAESLSGAADKIAAELSDAAIDVGDLSLNDLANEVVDSARHLARVAEPDYDDREELQEATNAVWNVNDAIERYMERATTVAEGSASKARAEAALNAVESAASFIADSSWLPVWADLVTRWDVLNFEERAIDYEERHRERYLEAGDEYEKAYDAWASANAKYHVARAEAAVASLGDAAGHRDARDALADASDVRDDAQADLDRAVEDLNYFSDLIVWRDMRARIGDGSTGGDGSN